MDTHEFPEDIQRDFNTALLGEYLGRGATRDVYVYNPDQRLVVKIEDTTRPGPQFQNVREMHTWEAVRRTQWASWFAPVKWISPLGTALFMCRTYTAPRRIKSLPSLVPEFLQDTRGCNWGWFKGRWVMHDYGMNKLLELALANAKMESYKQSITK